VSSLQPRLLFKPPQHPRIWTSRGLCLVFFRTNCKCKTSVKCFVFLCRLLVCAFLYKPPTSPQVSRANRWHRDPVAAGRAQPGAGTRVPSSAPSAVQCLLSSLCSHIPLIGGGVRPAIPAPCPSGELGPAPFLETEGRGDWRKSFARRKSSLLLSNEECGKELGSDPAGNLWRRLVTIKGDRGRWCYTRGDGRRVVRPNTQPCSCKACVATCPRVLGGLGKACPHVVMVEQAGREGMGAF